MTTKHCTSLEISKQLKEAGWRKETEFWWVKMKDKFDLILITDENYNHIGLEANDYFPAPLATEILEELPASLFVNNYSQERKLTIIKEEEFRISYVEERTSIEIETDKSLSNALAKMWLYLKKEGLIK